MADDYMDIGNESIFPLSPNWKKSPATSLTMTRRLHSFPGTAQSISELNPETPISFEALFTVFNKVDEYSLLEFIHAHQGRVVRFWVPYQRQLFELYEDSAIGAGAINCVDNGAAGSYQGYERIYILMTNGDMITRWVTSITTDGTKLSMVLDTPLDRSLELTNHLQIGRFLLVRFDSDQFELSIKTNNVFEITQRFYELVKEYAQLVAN
ncbi:MAG: hypothetical protein PF503_06215 [Desulfobacula sp.]|jgi:hypothetical protein|nr:hypothetical protein [Desulfobacula sp.]